MVRFDYGRSTQANGDDVAAAVAALNRGFLTLRSSPDQDATAREVLTS
ncbi:MAG: hypothetical protein H0U97_15370 [Gammaproteobacteria bacterium]|nr:hypothetical protein [Gammaproteobacteria bacterium]